MTTANSNTTTVGLVKWDKSVEADVRAAIASGKSVSKAVALSAPKGFISGLRAERRTALRQSGHLVIAQLETQGFKLEKCDANWDAQTKQLSANTTRKNGDEVIHLTVVKRAASPEEKELADVKAQLVAAQKELEAFRLGLSGKVQ